MRVFVSHASPDKPAVEKLAEELRARGIDPWLDKWEISSAADFVSKINQGLHESAAGIIVFSAASAASRWVDAEVSYLIWAYVEHGQTLVPVLIGDDVSVIPPLLRPLIRYDIANTEAIADALHNRKPAPKTPLGTRSSHRHTVPVSLRREDAAGLHVTLAIDGVTHGEATTPGLTYDLARLQTQFLQGHAHGTHRDAPAAARAAWEAALTDLGRHLGELCFPGDSGAALAALIDGAPVGTEIAVIFQADDPVLLGLAFDAARLPDGRALALQPSVVTSRRPLTPPPHTPHDPQPGPLKILLAVAAPDSAKGGGPLLDYEKESQNILDAVAHAQRLENCQVRVLELGHPKPIGEAFESDAYHVLHLSCHGSPGVLALEDEDGKPCPTTAAQLLDPIRASHRPLPLVLLSTCHGGVPEQGQTASFAQALLAGGVPAVVAMQAPVSDDYAIRLADRFYRALATGEHLRPSVALARARRDIEDERKAAVARGAPAADTQPEYATAALFVAGEEQPVADFGATKVPLHDPPVLALGGPVPQLSLGELIGRRHELRHALGLLRDPAHRAAGVVLTGIGGIGKSALAGRIMCRMAEHGWLVPAVSGPFSLTKIAEAIGAKLLECDPESKPALALVNPNLPDPVRAQLVGSVLARLPILLVLDDFEQNLTLGGDMFQNPDVASDLRTLAGQCHSARLLLTCRFPLPGPDWHLHAIAVPPLSPAETRKKLLRLKALAAQPQMAARIANRVTGGHPRILEFLDALLRAAPEREGLVVAKLEKLAAELGLDLSRPAASLDDAARDALALAERDVVLPELLEIVRRQGLEPALLQAAVSNLPVTADGLARMLADDDPGDVAAADAALARLAALSLLHQDRDGAASVHRWTAEGLRRLDEAGYRARCVRAGHYRQWQVRHETHALEDAVEALRNLLAGQAFGDATPLALAILRALSAAQQSVAVAALASEVLETLPETDDHFAPIADAEAQAQMALGFTDRAVRRYRSLLASHEARARAEPDRADYQRDLSVSYNKMGDLYRALGQGEAAREAYAKDLAIAERLAAAEPDRADYQRDLSVSYNKMGDLYRALGQGEAAREAYAKSLAIRERLAAAEPDRADYQRDLSVSYERMGDLYRALGQGEAAREAYAKALAIFERLAAAEPDRADYQRDLSVSYNKMGDLYRALGQGEAAREAYAKSLAIRERLAAAEPDRADYQRDLSVSYNKMGDLYRALGQGEAAREAYAKALAIFERLAAAEPDRADYQRDLAISNERLGDLAHQGGDASTARTAYQRSLAIWQRLAQAEPERADLQRGLVVPLTRLAAVTGGEVALAHLQRAVSVLETLRSEGRLEPADAGMLPEIRQMIEAVQGKARPGKRWSLWRRSRSA